MNWEPTSSPMDEIREIQVTISDTEVHVRWFWPNGIDFVYIDKTSADHLTPIKEQPIRRFDFPKNRNEG
ncbi:hypothetical protein V7128_14365 [Neobacillus vireti]|uniref:hypothetical protein n=1 Tax=Neobacillus vireti TaxID=220686 RepID=UPI002FFF35E2